MAAQRHVSCLVSVLFVLCAIACDEDNGDAASKDAKGDSGCESARVREDSTCCPPGTFYRFESDACLPVGPTGCASGALDATTCLPRWCVDAKTGLGRACTPAEVAAGKGCPVGQTPSSVSGDCVPAGHFPGSGIPANWRPEVDAIPPVAGKPPWPELKDVPLFDDSPPWKSGCPPGFITKAKNCVPDPADCPADPYGDAKLVDGAGVVFVDAKNGSDTNKGTRKKPLKTLSKAFEPGFKATTVALAAGTYAGGNKTGAAVKIIGQCAANVTVSGPVGEHALFVTGSPYIGRISITGPGAGLVIGAQQGVTIERVFVHDVRVVGIGVVGAGYSTIRETVVSGMLPVVPIQDLAAIMVQASEVDLVDVAIIGARRCGLCARQLSGIDAKRLLVRGVAPIGGERGYGLDFRDGTVVTLKDAFITDAHSAGILVKGANNELTGSQIRVGQTELPGGHGLGASLHVVDESSVSLQSSRLHRGRGAGVIVYGKGANVTLFDVLVDHARPQDGFPGDAGVVVGNGAITTLVKTRIHDVNGVGIGVDGPGATAVLNNVLVDKVNRDPGRPAWAAGVMAAREGKITISDTRITDCKNVGLVVTGTAGDVAATRLVVDNVQSLGDGLEAASGVRVSRDTHSDKPGFTLRDARVSNVVGAGVVLQGRNVHAHVRGLSVTDVVPAPKKSNPSGVSLGGNGLLISGGVRSQLDGVTVVQASRVGVSVSRLLLAEKDPKSPLPQHVKGVRFSANGLVVARTRPVGGLYGAGIYCEQVTHGCHLHASRVVANHTAGVWFRDATATVDETVIAATNVSTFAGGGRPIDIGDGLTAERSNVTVNRSLIAANKRAGLISAQTSKVVLGRSMVTGSIVGAVSSAGGNVDATTSLISGNETNRSSASLVLPTAPGLVGAVGK